MVRLRAILLARSFFIIMKPGFVIGNGRSRTVLNLEDLRKHGRTYGCNAIYRDFSPDILIATDPGITSEIEDSGYPLSRPFYTRSPNTSRGSRKIEHHWGYSSGPVALKYAAVAAHPVIYLLGFDLQGIRGLHNNVYSDTPHYKKRDESETYFGNWINQIANIMDEHKELMFIRLVDDQSIIPYRWTQIANHHTQSISDFLGSINSSPWQKPKELATNIRSAHLASS